MDKITELDLQWQATRWAVDIIDAWSPEIKKDWSDKEIEQHRANLLKLQDQLLSEKRRIKNL